MREPNPVLTMLANGDIDALLAHQRSRFGDTVMTADPAAAAPPAAPPASQDPNALVVPVTFDPQTGDPIPAANPATDPAGVWAGGVQPAPGITTVPAPTQQPAQPPQPPQPGQQPYIEVGGQRYYTESYLEQARSQERDKMHTRLGTIEQEMQQQRAEREAREQQIRDEAAAAAAEAERTRLGELPVEQRVEELQRTWEQRWAERDQQDAAREAMDAQERRYNDLMAYRQRRIAEEQDLIHPTLVDLVASPETGAASEQQIEESITALKAKTDAIVGSVQDVQVQQRAAMQTVAPTGTPPVGPLDQTSGYQSLSPADIAAMDPATYAKNRPAIMEALRRRNAERGLYG